MGKNRIAGPIEFRHRREESQLPIDQNLEKISQITKISMNQLTKIKSAMIKYSKNTFTSQELASVCGISSRTMNRIIERLIDCQYAIVSGKTVRSEAGRPRRILHFYI